MKIAIIGDPHFAIKEGSHNVFRYQKHFFDDILKPYLKEVDMVLFLGDMFHNRRNINLRILSEVTKLVKDIQDENPKLMIRGILGNHDFYFRNSYDIATVRDLNIGIRFGGHDKKWYLMQNCLFIHWHNSADELIETLDEIEKYLGDECREISYIFGHFSFNGYKLNSKVINYNEHDAKDSIVTSRFINLKKIITGHFHTPSEYKMVKYVGVPYQLTWSEANVDLGFNILDTDDKKDYKLNFIHNPNKAFEYIYVNDKIVKDSSKIINNIGKHDYRKLYKIVYNNVEQEPTAQYIYNQILIKEHDAQLIDTSLYDIDNELGCDDKSLSIEDLIKTYFNSSNLIPKEYRDQYYDLFQSFYKEAKNANETVEF